MHKEGFLHKPISRRGFLGILGIGVATVAAAPFLTPRPAPAASPPHESVPPTPTSPKVPNQLATAQHVENAALEPTPVNTYGPGVTREWLETHPQDIFANSVVKSGPNNEKVKQYVVVKKPTNQTGGLWNSVIYETHKDALGNFTEYTPLSQIPIENVQSLTNSRDGTVLIAAGEKHVRGLDTAQVISFDSGKTWSAPLVLPSDFNPLSGPTVNLVVLEENDTTITILGNNATFEETGVGQFILTVNKPARSSSIQKTNLQTIQKVNVNIGQARDLSLVSTDPSQSQAKFALAGSTILRTGVIEYDVNYLTATGTVENVKQVTINGAVVNLPYLDGNGTYRNAQGHLCVITSSQGAQAEYDIDLVTKTATTTYYADRLNNYPIPNLDPDSFFETAFDVQIDAQGQRKIVRAGTYQNTVDAAGRAVFIDEDNFVYDIAPNTPNGISQRDLERVTINGKNGYKLITALGEVFISTSEKKVYYIGDGLLKSLPGFKVYLPQVKR